MRACISTQFNPPRKALHSDRGSLRIGALHAPHRVSHAAVSNSLDPIIHIELGGAVRKPFVFYVNCKHGIQCLESRTYLRGVTGRTQRFRSHILPSISPSSFDVNRA